MVGDRSEKASCAVENDVVILPDDVQPGDVIECPGVRPHVTYEFRAYALVKVEVSGASRFGPL